MEMQYPSGVAYRKLHLVAEDEVPRRFQRADEVFEKKIWRDQLREWDETAKPAAIKTHRELQAIDPDELSDTDLVAYLTRCREHHSQMIYQHMRFTAGAVLPVGDLLAHLGDWTGVSPSDALTMMRGAAPVSAGASDELADSSPRSTKMPLRDSSSNRTAIPVRCSTPCARSTTRWAPRCPSTSTSWVVDCSMASTSPGATHSSSPTLSSGRSAHRSRGRTARARAARMWTR